MNPYLIDGPTCLSFSGGSTSGYMLWRTLQANRRPDLNDYLRVAFANTGREDEATLRFVDACDRRWLRPIGLAIEWVEYRDDAAGHAVVTFETASRDGEPFEALIKKRNYLPNPVTRFCTVELKIRAMHKRLKALGWHETEDGWDQLIGIRADEQRRVAKIRARGRSTESAKESMRMPLADAGVTWQEVDAFWGAQPFKLELARHNGRTLAGNCDLCFLKPPAQRLSLIREKPERAVWWARMEAEGVGRAPPTKRVIVGHRPLEGWIPATEEEYEEWVRQVNADLESGAMDEDDFYNLPDPRIAPSEAVYGEVPSDGWRFTKDGPSYAQMAKFAETQTEMFDPDQEALACFCGD